MELFIDIIYAILFIIGGYSIIKHRRNVKKWTGNWLWAEKYIWNGGTYVVLILIWLFMIFLWVLYPFWWLELIFWRDQISPDISSAEF